jgi:hypothetical protein
MIITRLSFSKRSHSWPSAVYIQLAYKTIAKLNGDLVLVEVSFSCGGKIFEISSTNIQIEIIIIIIKGTLINRKTVLTAGHCILREFDYDYVNNTYKIKVVPNVYYPKLSMIYKVYLGADATIRFIKIKKKIKKS